MKTMHDEQFAVRPLVLALQAALLAFAAQSAAFAEDIDPADLTTPVKSVELGVGHVGRDSFKAGDYTGLNRKGAYAIGNVDLNGGDAYDSDSARRWRLTGKNLGLDSREVAGEYGIQGKFRINFGYDELPKLRSDSYQTPFLGAGSTLLTLPSGWVAGPNTAGGTNGTTAAMTGLNAAMQDFDIKTKRTRTDVGFSTFIAPEWEVKASFRSERKEGTKILGAAFGNSGGNPRAVLLPDPIDTLTKQFDVSLGYGGKKAQFQVGYYASLFTNDVNSFMWQNPYSNTAWLPVTAGYPNFGQMGSAPDNQFHQVNFSGGYNFTPTTRLTVSGARGLMSQNEAFLPYTSVASLTAATPLPRSSLNGEIVTTNLNLRLTARPTPKLGLAAAYRYDDRDNRTPMAQYVYIGGDSANQVSPTAASDRIRTNLPRSSRLQALNLDADYHIRSGTGVKAGYDRESIKRTYAEVAENTENTYRIDLRHAFSESVSGTLGLAHGVRTGTTYVDNAPFLASYTSAAFIASLPLGAGCAAVPSCVWDNLPGQRKFYIADRKRDKVRAGLNLQPTDEVTVQLSLAKNSDAYNNSPYGLTDASGWSASVDSTYALEDTLSLNAFFTFEDTKSIEKGRQIGGSKPAAYSTADLDLSLIHI